MPESKSTIVLVGGPQSGKTTFIGVLWSVVRTAAKDAKVRLNGPLPPKTFYMDAAEHAILAGEEVERTKKGTGERIKLDLLVGDEPFWLEHIDLAGETLETALEARRIPEDLAQELQRADCLLLFVHPDKVRRPMFIHAANRRMIASPVLVTATEGEAVAGEAVQATDGEADPVNVWKSAPTSVHLVDLVQTALRDRTRQGPLSVAVVISAWDLIEQLPPHPTPEPSEWVRRHLALLHQFLESGPDVVRWAAFGVSAQGGDYSDPKTVERLVGLPCAERAIVVTESGAVDGIAAPLAWFAKG